MVPVTMSLGPLAVISSSPFENGILGWQLKFVVVCKSSISAYHLIKLLPLLLLV